MDNRLIGSVRISEIIKSGKPANRKQLEILYSQYVCCTTCPFVVANLSTIELKRMVSLGIYRYQMLRDKNKSMVIRSITTAIGISQSGFYKWIRNIKNI